MGLAGLILAAGESRRMGTPKALLELEGETFLDRLILILGEWCSPVIVVLGHDAQRVKAGVRYGGLATFATNQDYVRGQLSSLQCGLSLVPASAAGVMFTLVDHPAVRPSTVARLVRKFSGRSADELLVIPRSGGRGGHPVCVDRSLIAEFLALSPEATAREVIHAHPAGTVYVDVEDAGIIEDIDDPQAYRRLVEGSGRSGQDAALD